MSSGRRNASSFMPVPKMFERRPAEESWFDGDPAAPRDQKWRAGAKLPTLLTKDLLTYDEVCEDARRQNRDETARGNPPRRFALVLAKMHLCDYMTKSCMHAARTFFDPCNRFVAENFIPYHARTYFDGGAQPPGGSEMVKRYEFPSGPRLVAIDLETCLPLKYRVTDAGESYVETGIAANSDRMIGNEYAWKVSDRNVRFAEMRTRLRELLSANPGAAEKIEARAWIMPAEEIGCSKSGVVPVLADPIFVPELRVLMNEQYHQVTGQDASARVRWPKPSVDAPH